MSALARILLRSLGPLKLLILCWQVAIAQSPWTQPVNRNTDSRSADLITALIERGKFDEAVQICQDQFQGSDPRSDDAAQWAIRHCEVLTQQQMLGDAFNDQQVVAAGKPVRDLLAAYSDHRRALFLQAQELAVAGQAARHAVLMASVNPMSDAQIERVFTKLARVTVRIRELAESVDSARAALDSNPADLLERSLVADLVRLHQQLLIEVVSTSLLQTELFSAGGRDHIAAANHAQQAANQALEQLPPDTPARFEIERLRVQAILRSGQYDRAASDLDQLMRLVGKPFPPQLLALQVRVDVARDRLTDAARIIESFYRNGVAAAKSIDMDLARVKFLLANQDPRVGKWIDQIEQRSGVFARRRAEAIALASLRSSSSMRVVDASIIAAQGQDWLRRGNPKRAGELLAAAARAEQSADRAIVRATEAAAALIAAKQPAAAAEILSTVAIAQPTGKNAAQVHLQAAHLIASGSNQDTAANVEAILRATIKQWPQSKATDQARKWLVSLLSSQGRIKDAAVIATAIHPSQVTKQQLATAAQLWVKAVRECRPDQVNQIGREFLTSFAPLSSDPLGQTAMRQAAAIVLDDELLVRLDKPQTTSDGSDYQETLLRFRSTPAIATLSPPPPDLRIDTEWRLMRDAQKNKLVRGRNASVIQDWPGGSAGSLEQIQRLIWLGDVERAVQIAREIVKDAQSPGKTMAAAARLLGASDNRKAKAEAIILWDQLAAGIPKGTATWHEAKIEAIKLLAGSGRGDEAVKRAKFVLLTSPPKEDTTRGQYEALAKQASVSSK